MTTKSALDTNYRGWRTSLYGRRFTGSVSNSAIVESTDTHPNDAEERAIYAELQANLEAEHPLIPMPRTKATGDWTYAQFGMATDTDELYARRPAFSYPARLFTCAWHLEQGTWFAPLQGEPRWVLPVRGDSRMWDVLLPTLQAQPQFSGFKADTHGWDVYTRTEADARELARLVCGFDPFLGLIDEDGNDGHDDTVRRGDAEYRR